MARQPSLSNVYRVQTTNLVWKKNRNLHARLLLEQLRCGRLADPFTHTPPDGHLRTLMSWERSAINRCQCAPCSAPPTTTLLSAALSALQCQQVPSQSEPLLSKEDLQQSSGTPATCSDIFLLAQCLQRHTGSPLLPCATCIEVTLTLQARPTLKERSVYLGQACTAHSVCGPQQRATDR